MLTRRAIFVLATAAAGSHSFAQTQLPSNVTIWPPNSSYGDKVMMSTLAGIVNRSTNGELLISPNFGTQPNPRFWLDRLKEQYPSVQSTVQTNAYNIVNQYKSKVRGYVLYDQQAANAHSVNIATSIAGVEDAIAIQPGQEFTYGTLLGLPKIADARTMTYSLAYAAYPNAFNPSALFHQAPSFDYQLRDYAVMKKGFTYWTDPTALGTYPASQNPQGRVYGWANSEFELFNQASQANQQVVASNHNQSSSTTSRWQIPTVGQKHHVAGSVQTKANKHYVAFVMSDGDNVTWLTNGNATEAAWFGSPHRGKFNMTWDYSPTLKEVNPVAHNWYYNNAADGTNGGRDTFVAAGGYGTAFPSQSPDINGLAASINASMADADLRVTSILDTDYIVSGKLQVILDQSNVSGIMYKSYDNYYKGRNGAITWRNGKPIVGVKYSLWDGADSAASLVAALNARPRDGIDNEQSYSIVNVHPWSTAGPNGTGTGDPMSNLNYLVDQLKATGDNVEIVGLEELIIHLRNHFGTPVAGAMVSGTWTRNFSSDWGTQRTNWSGAMPNFVDATVNFGSGYITANRTVTVSTPVKAGTINFDNATYAYTITGTNPITLDTTSGPARINVAAGSHSMLGPVTFADDTVVTVTPSASTMTISGLQVSAAKLTKEGAGTLAVNRLPGGAVEINAGTVRTTSSASTATTLAIAGGAKLDLLTNRVTVTGQSLGDVEGLVNAGRLMTSSTTANAFTTLGVAPTGLDDVLVRYGYAGDADLDGAIDGDDFFQIDAGIASGGTLGGYYYGDFNHSGAVDADDYFLIDTNYARHLPSLGAGVVAVPEPAASALLFIASAMRRRRSVDSAARAYAR